MYLIRSFHAQACHRSSNIFLFCNGYKNAGDLDIWKIPFKYSFMDFIQTLQTKLSNEEMFVSCFWFCIFLAFIGLSEAVAEFIRVYCDKNYEPKTFWNREYCHIPMEYRRHARVLGSALNIVVNILLLYGISNFRDIYIYPWLTSNGTIILLEVFYGVYNFIGNKIFKIKPCISVIFLIFRFVMIWQMTIVLAEITHQ